MEVAFIVELARFVYCCELWLWFEMLCIRATYQHYLKTTAKPVRPQWY